jgi:glycine cleavage system regulatory protein
MAGQGVNVLDLETEYRSAPMSGTAIFEAHARLYLPPDLSATKLKRDLEKIAHDLMVDISLE